MWQALQAEWVKHRRSLAWWLVWALTPLMTVAVTAYSKRRSDDWAGYLSLIITCWNALVVPAGVALVAALGAQLEQNAGHWYALRSRAVPPRTLYGAKLLVLLTQVGLSTATAFGLAFIAGRWWLGAPGPLPWLAFAMATMLSLLTMLPLLALQHWIAVAGGFGPAIGVGGVGLFLAALLGATSLGNPIWPFIPWTWPVRVGVLSGYLLPEQSWSAAQIGVLSAGLIPSMALAAVATLGGAYWFSRWEGQPSQL